MHVFNDDGHGREIYFTSSEDEALLEDEALSEDQFYCEDLEERELFEPILTCSEDEQTALRAINDLIS